MWPDNETTQDLIGFQVHADLIRSVITNTSMLPTTIGVFGDWGGGKTSIMKMLERDLNPDNWTSDSPEHSEYQHTAVVYINTWLFEGYDDAKAAMLGSVLLELSEHKQFGPKIRDSIQSLLKSVNWMRLARLSMKHVAIPAAAAYFTGGLAAIPAAMAVSTGISSLFPSSTGAPDGSGQATENEAPDLTGLLKDDKHEADAMDVRTFRKRFSDMLADGGIKTLVVLVDDLDRCTPERIVENLEAVKLFLSVDQTAFVIGADRRIVEHAIRSRYAVSATEGNAEEAQRLVKDYLEKLVQVPYSLPRLSATEIETFMTLLFCTQHLSSEDANTCIDACNMSRSANRYASFGYAAVREAIQSANGNSSQIDNNLATALSFSATAAPLIADGLKGNPRQVKRFLNALLLRKQLANVAKLSNIRDDVLIKLMILEYVHLERFTELFQWQASQEGHPKQLMQLENALGPDGNVDDEESAKKISAHWATTSVRKWVAMEPLLGEIDLRDYFWVARDRLESTFSGISMVPPAVRAVLDGLLSQSTPKRNSAMKTAKNLSEDERISLLGLLKQRITRQYDDIAGYNALRYLSEADVLGAVELFADVLENGPLNSMPVPVGMQFMTLYGAKSELRQKMEAAKKRLLDSDTKIGAAAKSSNEVKK